MTFIQYVAQLDELFLVVTIDTIAVSKRPPRSETVNQMTRSPQNQADRPCHGQDATGLHQVPTQLKKSENNTFAKLVGGFWQREDQNVLHLNLFARTRRTAAAATT